MSAEKVAVRAMFWWLAVGVAISLLAFATQTPAFGRALAVFIIASPFLLVGMGVWLKMRTRAAKHADAGTKESARGGGNGGL